MIGRVTHVTIDGKKCQGHGRCALIAPQIFDVDDDGVGQVLVDEVASDDLEDTHDAVLGCPENAITLTE